MAHTLCSLTMTKRTGARFIADRSTTLLTSRSVVIKVGMVGDSQIGKTSLMVKYVEGSFDEDYLQTLGTFPPLLEVRRSLLLICGVPPQPRRQFHGEDDLSATDDDHILHLGPGRAARVREHASTRLQRRRGHPIHVRPLSQIDAKFGQGVVPSSAGVQQGVLSISPHTGHGILLTFDTACADCDTISHRNQV